MNVRRFTAGVHTAAWEPWCAPVPPYEAFWPSLLCENLHRTTEWWRAARVVVVVSDTRQKADASRFSTMWRKRAARRVRTHGSKIF